MSRSVALWGRQHTVLGEVAVEVPAPDVAIALSRGSHPKLRDYVDPNEDVTAAVAGERSTLAVVADGHNGARAAEAAVVTVGRLLGRDPPPADLEDSQLVELFEAAGEAALAAAFRTEVPQGGTTLALALVSAHRLQWASFGDSAVFAGDAERVRRLDRPRHSFLGYPVSPGNLARELSSGYVGREPGAWVVLASDGYTDFAGAKPEHKVRQALLRGSPEAVARGMVAQAFAGGAGDNVAVACVAPP